MFYWFLKRDRPRARSCALIFRPYVIGARERPGRAAAPSSPATTCRSPTRSSCRWSSSGGSPSSPRPTTSPARAQGLADGEVLPGVGQLPVDRSGGSASEAALRTGLQGARAAATASASTPRAPARPTAGSTAARPASPGWRWRPRCPVLPVAMIDTEKIQPPGRKMPDPRHPGRHQDRRAARLLPLRGHGGRPVRPALDHRRDHVRADGALRPGVRRHLRPGRQGPGQGREGRGEGRRARRRRTPRRRRAAPTGRHPRPDRWASRRRSGGRWRCSARSAWSTRTPCTPAATTSTPTRSAAGSSSALMTVVDGRRLRVLYSRPAGRPLAGARARPGHRGGRGGAAPLAGRPDRIEAGAQTLPVVWAAAPVLAFAIRGGWPAGLGAAAVVGGGRPGAPRRAHRADREQHRAAAAGRRRRRLHRVDLARRGEAALARALAVQAAAAGARAALPRHPRRRAAGAGAGRAPRPEAGGEAAEIGRLAAEQEQALRALVGAAPRGRSPARSTCAALLAAYASSGGDRLDPRDAGGARRRPGPASWRPRSAPRWPTSPRTPATAARAWVLVEDEGDELVVSACATTGAASRRRGWPRPRAEGRLGVASSIEGRVRDLGGTMAVESAPGAGTEVELRVPVRGRR